MKHVAQEKASVLETRIINLTLKNIIPSLVSFLFYKLHPLRVLYLLISQLQLYFLRLLEFSVRPAPSRSGVWVSVDRFYVTRIWHPLKWSSDHWLRDHLHDVTSLNQFFLSFLFSGIRVPRTENPTTLNDKS